MKALPSRSLGGGEVAALTRGMITHTKTPGNGIGPASGGTVHSRWGMENGGDNGPGVTMPIDSRNNPPGDMKGR